MTVKGKNLRIAQDLKERILSGGYPVDSKLEPISTLAKQFKTTVVTMSRALDILENEGLIERINGLGVFVKKQVKYRFAIVFDSKAEMGLFAHKAVFMKYFIDYCHDNGSEYKVFEDIDTVRDCNRVRKFLRENSFNAVLISSRAFAVGAAKYLHGIPIAAIGLYAYKDLDTCIHSDTAWTANAYKYLLDRGCRKIAVLTNHDSMHLWQNPEIMTQEEIYGKMSNLYPDFFDSGMFLQVDLTPRSGYEATCSLLDTIPKDQKIGLVVTDSILTHGAISAALQKQYRIGENLIIVSHALNGFNLCQFAIPVVTAQDDISRHIAIIDSLLLNYCKTGTLERGIKITSSKIILQEE